MRIAIVRNALFVLLLTPLAAQATTLIHQDTRALVRGSSDVVVGRVVSTTSRWSEGRRHIVTEVTVEVAQSLKGERTRLTLVQLGGELDGMRYSVPGSPTFQTGEEALLFVWRDARGNAQVNGMAQGKFEIRRDAATGEALIQRATPGLAIDNLRTLRPLRADRVAPPLTLRRMLGEIRTILAEDGR